MSLAQSADLDLEPLRLEAVSNARVEALGSPLGLLLASLPRSLGYDADGPAWRSLFEVAMAAYDHRLTSAERKRCRQFLQRHLPVCFRRGRAMPGRKRLLREGETDRLRWTDARLRALVTQRSATVAQLVLTLKAVPRVAERMREGDVTKVVLRDFLDGSQGLYDKRRDLLAYGLGVTRRTLDRWLSPRTWRPVSRDAFRRAHRQTPLLLTAE